MAFNGLLGLGGASNPYLGLLGDTLSGVGIGLLNSNRNDGIGGGIGQGLLYANQFGQQRRMNSRADEAQKMAQAQLAIAQQTAAQQQQAFQQQQAQQQAQKQAATQLFGGLQTNGAGSRPTGAGPLASQPAMLPPDPALAGYTPEQISLLKTLEASNPGSGIGLVAQNAFPKPTDQPATVKEYQFAQSQGYQGTLNDFIQQKARAGASSTTINMPPAEKAYNTELGKQEGGEIGSIAETANTARSQNDQLAVAQALRQQLQAAGTDTSRALPLITQISALGQALGVDTSRLGGQTPDVTAATQALDAITKKLALGNIGSGKDAAMPANNFTEADRAFVVGIAPNISDTPEGFGAKSLIQQRVNKRALDKEAMWNSGKYDQLNEADYRRFKKDWAEYVSQHPLFNDTEKQQFMSLVRTGSTSPVAPAAPASTAAPIVAPKLPPGFD